MSDLKEQRRECACGAKLQVITSVQRDLHLLLDAWAEMHPDGGYVGKDWHVRVA